MIDVRTQKIFKVRVAVAKEDDAELYEMLRGNHEAAARDEDSFRNAREIDTWIREKLHDLVPGKRRKSFGWRVAKSYTGEIYTLIVEYETGREELHIIR